MVEDRVSDIADFFVDYFVESLLRLLRLAQQVRFVGNDSGHAVLDIVDTDFRKVVVFLSVFAALLLIVVAL